MYMTNGFCFLLGMVIMWFFWFIKEAITAQKTKRSKAEGQKGNTGRVKSQAEKAILRMGIRNTEQIKRQNAKAISEQRNAWPDTIDTLRPIIMHGHFS